MVSRQFPLTADTGEGSFEPIGACEAMQEVFRCIDGVASTGVSILILGEPGTGKKLLGRLIHQKGSMGESPFLIANETNLGEILCRWDERTGETEADAGRSGNGGAILGRGTLFIDEINELSLSSQRQLLRLLQEDESSAHGNLPGSRRFRIIASSSCNLHGLVLERVFREDLFYRLNVVTLHIPPLRNRGSDLMQLAGYFMERFARQQNKKIDAIAPKAIKLMLAYEWPGNVRELADTIERAVLATDSSVIEKDALALVLRTSVPEAGGLFKLLVSEYEKRLINEALATCKGKLNKAARLLRTSNRVISYKVKKYAIDYVKYR